MPARAAADATAWSAKLMVRSSSIRAVASSATRSHATGAVRKPVASVCATMSSPCDLARPRPPPRSRRSPSSGTGRTSALLRPPMSWPGRRASVACLTGFEPAGACDSCVARSAWASAARTAEQR